jgi:serine/threonine protein kinase
MDNNSQTNQNEDEMIGKLIFDRYKLIKRLGAGSFGSIYEAVYQNQYYAIKLEEKNRGQNLLETEAYIMSYLHGPGLPFVKSYGYSSKHNILVMELMGESLEDKFEGFVVKKMSNRCVCNIGYQMIEILEYIHNKHVIHRDIKPDNFVVGRGEKRKYIYILDFGLSKKYRSSRTLKHYQILKSKNLTGTARYASINALNGLTQSRRDDLEAVGYVLMYFLRGRLPWQGIPVKNKEDRYRKIMEKKMATSAEELCMGFPNEFADYINYTRNLQYEQDPDYNYLKNLFLSVLSKSGYRVDCYYDWDKETINYFRDFKNVDNIKNNKNKNDSSSVSTNQQFNMKDVNSFASTENKTYNKINNNIQKYNSNSNNNLSMVNYQGNNKISGFVNSASGSGLYQNRIGQENPNTNELINGLNKDQSKINYIQGNQTSQTQVNNIQNNGIYNNSVNIGNNNNNQENNKNLEQQQLNKDHNYDKNEVKELPKEQKNMNPRADKDNKCCLIF